MDFLGDKTLLDRTTVGFLASRNATPSIAARCRAWVESICGSESVIISGFHSPLEQELFRIFFERRQPVVWVLGRSIYRRMEPELLEAIDEGRLLLLSVCPGRHHSRYSAQLRNRYVAMQTHEMVFAAFEDRKSTRLNSSH